MGTTTKRSISILIGAALLFALTFGSPAAAQEPAKVPRIGYLSLRAGIEPREEQFRSGLRELGYVEGQSIVIEWRFAANKEDRIPEFAAERVRLKVDVIVAAGTQAIRADRKSVV